MRAVAVATVLAMLLAGVRCRLCSRPPGAPAQRGTVAAWVLERRTLRLLEFGLGDRLDAGLLGRVQTLALP